MTDRFPLLRLPQDALNSVLRSMKLLDLILVSFLSNRAKSIVASINMKAKVKVVVSNDFTISVSVGEQRFQFQFYCHEVKNGAIPIKMGIPGIVYLIHFMNGAGIRSMLPKVMDIPSWFSHIKTIFNCPKISILQFFEDVGNFDLDAIRDRMIQAGFNNDCSLMVFTRSSDEYNRKIMKTFRNIKYLFLETEVYENGKPPGEVLIQNFHEFSIGIYSTGPTMMKPDDILMMNSKDVIIASSELTEKDANRFLKLWMRGNSKLEYFSLSFVNEINVDRDTNSIEGGTDFTRRDGTRGTIIIEDGFMEFYVWHDHCKVEK